MINVLGDALAAGIMAHICKKDFEKAAAAAAAAATAAVTNGGGRVRTFTQLIMNYFHYLVLTSLLLASLLQRDTVISFGNQSVALSDAPLIAQRCDYVFEVDGDNVLERPVTCYNLCHV